MATFKYTGESEREFPSIGKTLQPGDSFEASSDFDAPDVILIKTPKATPKEIEE